MKLLCDVFVELFLLFGLVQRLLIGIRIGEMVAVFIILVAIYVYGFGVDVIQDRWVFGESFSDDLFKQSQNYQLQKWLFRAMKQNDLQYVIEHILLIEVENKQNLIVGICRIIRLLFFVENAKVDYFVREQTLFGYVVKTVQDMLSCAL
jgi:hypothetical protein